MNMQLYQPIKGEVVHFFDGVSQYDYERFPQGKNEDVREFSITCLLSKVSNALRKSLTFP